MRGIKSFRVLPKAPFARGNQLVEPHPPWSFAYRSDQPRSQASCRASCASESSCTKRNRAPANDSGCRIFLRTHSLAECAGRTVMTFSRDAMWTIVILSRGLPYFTQTLSKFAALHAIENRRLEVTNDDVEASMSRFIDETEKAFKEAYRAATRSNQSNFFEHSLLACALAKTDDEGFFTANDVVEPYSAIMKEKKRIAHFEKHLRRFSSDEGGNILHKCGGDRQQQFRFKDPMMQPYVIIRGIQNKLIPEADKAILLQREQGTLAI